MRSRFAFFSLLVLLLSNTVFTTTVKAETLTLDEYVNTSYKGQVVYMEFWASWCPNCRRSFPWLNEMQAKYQDKGLTVIGVNIDEDAETFGRFMLNNQLDFTIVKDPFGMLASQYQIQGVPTAFLIDRSGKIILQHLGFRHADKAVLETAIKEALSKK